MSSVLAVVVLVLCAGCGRSGLYVAAASGEPDAAGGAAGSREPPPASAACGNLVIEAGEECDRNALGGAACRDLGFGGGGLRCGRDCRYDTSACIERRSEPEACAEPLLPISLPRGCAEAMCECDRQAWSGCELECWSRVACRVATCFNNPSRRECTEGCSPSTEAELSLGRCFQASAACTQR